MGIGSYFKVKGRGRPTQETPTVDEKSQATATPSVLTSDDASQHALSLRHDIIANWLLKRQCVEMWIAEDSGPNEGVLVRRARNDYIGCPQQVIGSAFHESADALNLQCCMTINSRVVKTFLASVPSCTEVPLSDGQCIQVFATMKHLPRARKMQQAAFIADEGLLVVWDEDWRSLLKRGSAIEVELMEHWTTDTFEYSPVTTRKNSPQISVTAVDEEVGGEHHEKRLRLLLQPFMAALTLLLQIPMLGLGVRQLVRQHLIDGSYYRFALLALVPLLFFFSLFMALIIVSNIMQMIGPVSQMAQNSKFYSGVAPKRLRSRPLPHVTIQCPVYKEGLAGVIAPTLRSLRAAISTYELQGGSANIFINDDGLQLISEEERQARIEFYHDNNVGWTARPKHGEDGFVRRGKFKKASNMNYALMLSQKVEEKLQAIERPNNWTQDDESVAYERCLKEVVAENGRVWADGNIRIGDYILIVDSDTRVPTDCLLDAVSEMEQGPEVAIMQFTSGVMNVTQTYFENAIAYFTTIIYTSIKFGVSSGDLAPFVGHNAVLRWSAVQEIGYTDEDGYEKYWSEAHVSEDFEMSLQLQTKGYVCRLAAWAGDGFKEGVSLTVYDELNRWEKYAYGCNELMFHPIHKWFYKGPFTPLFRRFITSNLSIGSKMSIVAYIGTYYAIGASWIFTVANYFVIGWYQSMLDAYYLQSFDIWFSVVVVFMGLGMIGQAALRYRIGAQGFFSYIIETLTWLPLFAVFFGGLSLHMSQAIVSHMFSIDMQWGATSKEADDSNFFIEVPRILRKFKFSMLFCIVLSVGMAILAAADFVPYFWRIDKFVAIFPMCVMIISHFLLPIALNPALMTFKF